MATATAPPPHPLHDAVIANDEERLVAAILMLLQPSRALDGALDGDGHDDGGDDGGGGGGGGGVNITDMFGRTALHVAVMLGRTNMIQMLIHVGAYIDARDVKGRTPLHLSLRRPDVTSMLLRLGADVDAKDAGGSTALHDACDSHNGAAAEMLLRHGANVETESSHGCTVLHWAAANDEMGVLRILLACGAMIDRTDDCGRTALFHAMTNGSKASVRALISAGANPSVCRRVHDEATTALSMIGVVWDALRRSSRRRTCASCGTAIAERVVRRCGSCRAVTYCGPECQQDHWPTHKLICPVLTLTLPAEQPAHAHTATDV